MAYPVYKKVYSAGKFSARSHRFKYVHQAYVMGTKHHVQIFLYSNHSVRKTFGESNPQSNTCKFESSW